MDVNNFKREIECHYKEEHYSVRDNGAIMRHVRLNKRSRENDQVWTFGTPNSNGYMRFASHVVHRIVAHAFLGEPPGPDYIVDHIDTNRQNNRPENLRWLTKLENILNNPITLKKIKFYCGSIEAFLDNPSILADHVDEDRNFEWMKTVTPEEAQRSKERLNEWADKKNAITLSKGYTSSDWMFRNTPNTVSVHGDFILIQSDTPNAIQENWNTPSVFPYCPHDSTDSPIANYAQNLKIGEVFSKNKYSESVIVEFAVSTDQSTIWVMCESNTVNGTKPWTLAQVTHANDLFIHKNFGSFFTKDGAKKSFTLAQGLEWIGGNTFDDLC